MLFSDSFHDEIIAKSNNESLAKHIDKTILVLNSLLDNNSIFQRLENILTKNNFLKLSLKKGLIFHDLGKFADGFQIQLKKSTEGTPQTPKSWKYRHEILSIELFLLLNPNYEIPKLLSITYDENLCIYLTFLSVCCHHKTIDYLKENYNPSNQYAYQLLKEKFLELKNNIVFLTDLKNLSKKNIELNLILNTPNEFCDQELEKKINSIKTGKFDIPNYYEKLLKPWKNIEENLCWKWDENNSLFSPTKSLNLSSFELFFLAIVFRGLIICSDHLASAGYTKIKTVPTNFFKLFQEQKPTWILNNIQEKAKTHIGDCFLFAPTAYGKTEAGLLWANNNRINCGERIFFILPYTASCNKMFDRLASYYGKDNVGILHSKTQSFLFEYFGRYIEENNQKNKEKIKNMISVMSKNYLPIKVITPFQILKLFYGYNGFETNMIEFLNAKLIFDEIHVYDPSTMAQIMVSVRFLKFTFNANFLFMTATMPKFLQDEFQNVLTSKNSPNHLNPICLPANLLKNRIRHKIKMVNSSIIENDQLNPLLSVNIKIGLNKSKKILIVCNTVVIAKKIYSLIYKEFCICEKVIKKNQIGLIHGGLIQKDRNNAEKKLDQYNILIGTQAIEVSLDIDYNIGYFELAPLDAIIQRAGRINRTNMRKNPEEIIVFYDDTLLKKSNFSIYSKDRIELSKNILLEFIKKKKKKDEINNDYVLISDYDYNRLVEKLYIDGYNSEEKLIFDNTKSSFENFISSYMRPFQANSNLYQQFEELFDSITILPKRFLKQYRNMIYSNEFHHATELTLNISKRKYSYFKKKNLTEYITDLKINILNIDYQNEYGLDY